jgi:hypothetical protein
MAQRHQARGSQTCNKKSLLKKRDKIALRNIECRLTSRYFGIEVRDADVHAFYIRNSLINIRYLKIGKTFFDCHTSTAQGFTRSRKKDF